MKRKIILAVVFLVVLAAIIGFILYSKKVTNYAKESPDFTTTAQELVEAFSSDSSGARLRFMDKIIRVTGRVKSSDSSAVVLGEEGNPSDVIIGLDDRNATGIGQIRVGQPATLQGKFSGYSIASGNPDDLISSLGGTTVNIDYAGVIREQ